MYDARYAEEQEAKYRAALAEVKPVGLVLDVGCGSGLLFSRISSDAESVVGVDVSKGLLLEARGRAKTLNNVNLVQADADNLPFKKEQFSTVSAFTVLQNMPKPLETLLEIRRTAREGAVVTVTGLKKTFSARSFGKLLRNAGLNVVSVKDEENLKCYVAISLKQGSE
jgi:ubiquinone/menaquinone biosynthesis C-methylase UbiE